MIDVDVRGSYVDTTFMVPNEWNWKWIAKATVFLEIRTSGMEESFGWRFEAELQI